MSTPKKPLTKTEILAELAANNDMSKVQVAAFLDSLCALAYRQAKKSAKFTLPGFGILKLQQRAARVGRNPATGESINIPKKTVVKFILSKACKEAILHPGK